MLTRLSTLLTLLSLVSTSSFSQQRSPNPTGGVPANQGHWDSVAHSQEFGEVTKARTAEDEGKIKFRSETTLIQVPVVVTDKSGNHLQGLNKDDFRIFENGKEQKISTFEEFVASTSKIPPPPTSPGTYSNLGVSESGKQAHAVTVLVIDTVNTPFLDQAVGRHELVKYLANNMDTSQILALMIINSSGVKVVQGLTGDPNQLLQVLKKVGGELPQNQGTSVDYQANAALGDIPQTVDSSQTTNIAVMMAAVQSFQDYADTFAAQFQQSRAIEMTMNSFLSIAWSLSGVPGRKSIIWATSGFPFVISAPDVVPGNLGPLYERMMKALIDGQISVYPVDVRGIITRGEGEATPQGGFLNRAGSPAPGTRNNRMWLNADMIQSLNEFADMTGGKAFYNTNDLAGSFKRAADDSSSYYLVGYYLDTKNNHAGWRQLKVEVGKKDVEIRARKGFFVTRATVDPDSTRDYDLHTALTSPIDGTGVPVTLKWTGITGEGDKKKAGYQIQIPPNAVTIEGGDQSKLNFDIAIAAYNNKSKDDKPVVMQGQTIDTAITPQQLASVRSSGITINKNFEVGPGQYSVRLVIRDSATGKIGTVTAPLTVN